MTPDRETFSDYHKSLSHALSQCEATDLSNVPLSLNQATQSTLHLLSRLRESGRKVLLIGNGGSASIVSHMQNDLCKCSGLRAMVLTEIPLLTALTNDESYDIAYERQIHLWGEIGDLLIAVSSSGQSENILRSVHMARKKEMTVITLSGFNPKNALRQMGDLNYYIPSPNYGTVELGHAILAHYLTDQLAAIPASKSQPILSEQLN